MSQIHSPQRGGRSPNAIASRVFGILSRGLVFAVVTFAPAVLSACATSSMQPTTAPTTLDTSGATAASLYGDPEPVTIRGYIGPEEDPSIAPDGTILFFDSHVDRPQNPIKIYWAKKINYKTFIFQGEVKGVTPPGDATFSESMDRHNNFYFILQRHAAPFPVTMHGVFKDGTVSGVSSVTIKNVQPPTMPSHPGQIVDVIIGSVGTPDGGTMYLSDLRIQFGGGGAKLVGGLISFAIKNPDGTFSKVSGSDYILEKINALGAIPFGGTESPDGRKLFFTRSDVPGSGEGHIRIYVAARSLVSGPFGTPTEITTPWPTVEAPYPSSDGEHIYFHHLISDRDAKIYVLTRR